MGTFVELKHFSNSTLQSRNCSHNVWKKHLFTCFLDFGLAWWWGQTSISLWSWIWSETSCCYSTTKCLGWENKPNRMNLLLKLFNFLMVVLNSIKMENINFYVCFCRLICVKLFGFFLHSFSSASISSNQWIPSTSSNRHCSSSFRRTNSNFCGCNQSW